MAKEIILSNGKTVYKDGDNQYMSVISANVVENDILEFYTHKTSVKVSYDDLDTKYGTADAKELLQYFIDNDFFSIGGGIALPIAISDVDGLETRLSDLETKTIKAIWYEEIVLNTNPDGQNFTVTPPTGGTILANGWGATTTALVKQIKDQVPTDEDIPDNDVATPEIVLAATLDTLGNGSILGNCNTTEFSSIAIVYYYNVAWSNYDPSMDLNDLIVIDEGFSKYDGHEQYTDSQYTEASPFVINSGTRTILPNNGVGDLNDTIPSDYDTFLLNNTLNMNYSQDVWILRIKFNAKSSLNNGRFDYDVDISDDGVPSPIKIVNATETFAKSANVEQGFLINLPIYSRDTFVANGGKIYITPNNNMSIYDIQYLIIRISKSING